MAEGDDAVRGDACRLSMPSIFSQEDGLTREGCGVMRGEPEAQGFLHPKKEPAEQRTLKAPDAQQPAPSAARKRSPTSIWVESATDGSDLWEAVRDRVTTGLGHFLVVSHAADDATRRLQAVALFEAQAWSSCTVAVRVEGGEGRWHVVEFQRIKGDSICFNDVFLLTCKALSADFTVCNGEGQPWEVEVVPEPLSDPGDDLEEDSSEIAAAIQQLLKMAQRPAMRGEAAAGLADASRHYAKQIAGHADFHPAALQLLELRAPEVAFPVARLLERVAATDEGRETMTSDDGQPLLTTVRRLQVDDTVNPMVRARLDEVVKSLKR